MRQSMGSGMITRHMLEHFTTILATSAVVLHWCIIVGLGLRILLKRRPTGVSMAWLLLITTVPFMGAALYLFVGELWLPRHRIKVANSARAGLQESIEVIEDRWEMDDQELPPLARGLNAQSGAPMGLSALKGNDVRLYETCEDFIEALINDIDHAQHSVSMLFYIWQSCGKVIEVEEALVRAANRGIRCRLLIDSGGSRGFFSSTSAATLRKAGIEICEALPVGRLRLRFKRIDIRNHRKIISIDNHTAYAGSMNMVDPAYFSANQGFGQWIDVMSRVSGPAARVLAINLAFDWAIEDERKDRKDTNELLQSLQRDSVPEAEGDIAVQIVPSGPDQSAILIQQMLITLMYNARKRLIITTPYFIPGEAMLSAMMNAADRGVRVSLVVPEKIDSLLVRHASRAYFEDLLDVGVEIYQYRGGLLHSKTVTADDDVALLGSLNMDRRSFTINYEISMFVYNTQVLQELRNLQQRYIEKSIRVERPQWANRPVHSRLVENALQLLAPLL